MSFFEETIISDGSGHTQPAGDAVSRPIIVELTDETNKLGTTSHPVQTQDQSTAAMKTDLDTISAAIVAQASTTSGQNGELSMMATVTAAPTDANAKTNPLRGDAGGCLRVNPAGTTGSFTSATSTGAGNVNRAITVPAGKKWILKSAYIKCAIANSGAARSVGYFVNDAAANTLAAVYMGIAATINTQTAYTVGPSLPLSAAITLLNATAPFPELTLGPGATINTTLPAGVAGDTITLNVCVEEHFD